MGNDRQNGRDLGDAQDVWGSSTKVLANAAAQHVYVTATGNDSAAGTAAAPKATLAGAFALLPLVLAGPFIVHIGTGTYAFAQPAVSQMAGPSSYVAIVGDGGGAAGADGLNTVAGSVAALASSSSLVVKAAGLTTDSLLGCTLIFTSGAAAGCRRTIAGNTATDIRLASGLVNASGASVAPAAGDLYVVTRPGPVLNIAAPAAADGLVSIKSSLHLVNVALAPATTSIRLQSDRGSWFGVEVRDNVCLQAGQMLTCGTMDTDLFQSLVVSALGGSTLLRAHWEGWGATRTTTQGVAMLDTANAGTFIGYTGCRSQLQVNGASSALRVLGGSFDSFAATGRNCEGTIGYCFVGAQYNDGIFTSGDAEVALNADVVVTPAGSTLGITIQGKSRFRAENTVTINSTSSAVALRVNGAASAAFGAALSITYSGAGNAVAVSECGTLACGSSCTVSASGNGAVIYTTGCGAAYFGSLVVTSTAPNANGLYCDGVSRVGAGSMTITCVNNALVGDNAQVTCVGGFSLTGVSGAGIAIAGPGASLACNNAVNISCNGSAALFIDRGGRCSMPHNSATKTITNNATAAGVCAIRVCGGAQFDSSSNVSATTASASGYGLDARGGGRAFFAVQPTGVVGTAADFVIGPSVGDQFPDTDLSGSYSSRTAGASSVQRAA